MSPAAASSAPATSASSSTAGSSAASSANPPATDRDALIAEAAKDLADYQRLTSEGKLGEAGQKLEQLKRTLDKLNTSRK